MKKFSFVLLLLLLLFVALIAGCSDEGTEGDTSSGDSKGEGLSGEITVWAHPFTGDQETEGVMWDEPIGGMKHPVGGGPENLSLFFFNKT